ncbi:TolC family protein [Rubrolithibacter danxiaensis]|uniref:TolC family protein n=1 Tax=Rubrolithibacter danxiaensis TaxID=3390805 RepID=UPI003BF86404
MKLTKWLNRTVITLVTFISLTSTTIGQNLPELSLEEAQRLAREHYPALKQKNFIKQAEEVSISNLNKGFLPQISINGQATYQSEVTSITIPIPGINIDPPSKDQYKATTDINQLLFDGGVIRQQKKIQKLSSQTEAQRTEVELYQLRERVDQIYLTILLLEQQQKQISLIYKDLQTGIAKVLAQVQNGTAFRSNLDVLKAELLKTDQRSVELESSREGLLNTLSVLTGTDLNAETKFAIPPTPVIGDSIQRPELDLYEKQEQLLNQQKKLVAAKNLPKASLFGQGGYGRPGLNFLKDEFDWFYIAGAKLTWNLSSLYTAKAEKKLIDLNKNGVEVQKETFLINTQSQLKQQLAEIKKLKQLIISDETIISLREKVKMASRAQLESGVITANDYLREVNAEDQARQSRIIHQMQVLQAQINYQHLTGF